MSESAKPSRRLFLAAGPAAAVFGALGAAAAAPVTPDLTLDHEPILAAIERHQAAEGAFTATLRPVDKVYARLQGREVTASRHSGLRSGARRRGGGDRGVARNRSPDMARRAVRAGLSGGDAGRLPPSRLHPDASGIAAARRRGGVVTMADTTKTAPRSFQPRHNRYLESSHALHQVQYPIRDGSPRQRPIYELGITRPARSGTALPREGQRCDGRQHAPRHRGPTTPDRCKTGRRRPLFSRGARSRALENPSP